MRMPRVRLVVVIFAAFTAASLERASTLEEWLGAMTLDPGVDFETTIAGTSLEITDLTCEDLKITGALAAAYDAPRALRATVAGVEAECEGKYEWSYSIFGQKVSGDGRVTGDLRDAALDVRLDFGADGGAQGVLAYLQVVDDVFALFANAARRPGAPPAVAKWRSFADLLRAAEEEDAAGARGSLVDVNVRGAADAVQKWRERTPRLTAALRGANAARAAPTVTFATSHKTKGLEFDTVVVGDDFAALVDDHGAPSKFVKKEEIHAWHVALTRAKRALYVPPKFAALQDLHARTRKVVPGAPPPPPPGPAQVGLLAVVQAPPGPAPVSIGAMMLAKKAPAARKRHPGW
mmetsp:Transcript_4304/g.13643  ORF Transcript_4304/g.13643 Transcript_4304/m.13643 type:complete len:349 (-) Transcript_4304:28-1074(-)